MASSYTANKSLEKPANGDYVDTWEVPVNSDMDVIDQALGSTTSLNATSGSATLTATQYRSMRLYITGSISSGVTYTIPSGVGGQWIIDNATSGAGTITIASAGAGTSVVCAQGKRTQVFSDGTNINLSDDNRTVPAGSNTQIQYNNSGAFGASSGLTWDGTTFTATGSITNGTVTLASNNITASAGTLAIPDSLNVDANTLYVNSTSHRVGIGMSNPAQKLSVAGTVESTTGGFKFPDGTTQTTAAATVGTVTSVGTGAGLTGGPITSSGTISVATAGITSTMLASGAAVANIGYTPVNKAGDTVTGALTVSGTFQASGAAVVTGNLQVDTNVLFVNASTNRVGIGTSSPAQPLSVVGVIESTSGGVKFPDATTQTSAATTIPSMQVFTASGTFTVPAGVTKVRVTVVGGGGGGSQYSGGGGGGTAIEVISGLTPGGTVAVTVGAGGAGATSGTASSGGTSSFGAYCSATGGGGGPNLGASATGGLGGDGSGGNLNIKGSDGSPGNGYETGRGGSSYLGGGGSGYNPSYGSTGGNGGRYGGGAGASGTSARAGADGVVIVEY